MTERRERLVWLDLEMTGLDPEHDTIVQAAAVVTEIGSFEELEVVELPIWQPESRLELMTPFVREMHGSSGLLDKVRKSKTSLLDAERALLKLVARWCGPQEGILAGNSIWQDRRFLMKYMPAFEGFLHFRQVDVTSWKIMARAWLGERGTFPKAKAHTALEDVRASIAELRFYKDRFGLG
ncbi:MAG TPA: oligoribonuclease [Planctomycetota bacterium]|nr:oligoribonuclease [Planctomycetota bacterium]